MKPTQTPKNKRHFVKAKGFVRLGVLTVYHNADPLENVLAVGNEEAVALQDLVVHL